MPEGAFFEYGKVKYETADGKKIDNVAILLGPDLKPISLGEAIMDPVVLLDGLDIPANGASAPVEDVPGGTYIFEAMWTGAATGVRIEALGLDGETWIAGPEVASGEAEGIRIGQGATLRVKNMDVDTAVTAGYARVA